MTYADELRDLIRLSPYLHEKDHVAVNFIASKYQIDEGQNFINEYLITQSEIEAAAVYLTGKYTNTLNVVKGALEDAEADVLIGIGDTSVGGYKLTRQDKSVAILCDISCAKFKAKILKLEALVLLLERLSIIVFRRYNKLEQLSVNYRRETEADKRHSF